MAKRKIIITGANGQLGFDLIKSFSNEYEIFPVDVQDFDIRDYSKIDSCLKRFKPDIVIHSAANTNVDDCESNAELAMSINATGTEYIARACHEIGARMIYFSTDYVFDGQKRSPYKEDDSPHPVNIYGRSKLEGEIAVQTYLSNFAILRIAWLYGAHGRNFVKTIIRLGNRQLNEKRAGRKTSPIEIVDDQIGNPTWTMEVVNQTRAIIENGLEEVIHCTSGGETSWYKFARAIFQNLAMPVDIRPCRTDEHPRPAKRPSYSSLENKLLKEYNLNIMRHHDEALREFLSQHGEGLKNEI